MSCTEVNPLILLELKGYLRGIWGIIGFLAAGLLIAAVLWYGILELSDRGSLFEPFTLGVVDNDGTPELIFVFDFFNEYVIDLEFMESDEALMRLSAGDIPAFVELPSRFTQDVFQGINSPFTVHVDSRFPLQGNLVQLLASGGIAYLSASQAGVYATLGYAHDAGVSWPDVQRNLLIPVNMAFLQEMLRFDDIFRRELVQLIEGSVTDYFIVRFAVFWHILSLIILAKFLPAYSPGMLARFKLAQIPWWQIGGIKWTALFIVLVLISIPIMPFIGILGALSLSAFVTAFGLLVGNNPLLTFFSALLMYFASGGIIPFVFLPRELLAMRWVSINYWIASGNIALVLGVSLCLSLLYLFGYALKMREQ